MKGVCAVSFFARPGKSLYCVLQWMNFLYSSKHNTPGQESGCLRRKSLDLHHVVAKSESRNLIQATFEQYKKTQEVIVGNLKLI